MKMEKVQKVTAIISLPSRAYNYASRALFLGDRRHVQTSKERHELFFSAGFNAV